MNSSCGSLTKRDLGLGVWPWVLACVAALLLFVWPCFPYLLTRFYPERTVAELGATGDIYGAYAALVAMLGLAAAIGAVLIQVRELKCAQQELHLTRKELESSRNVMEEQRKDLEQQRFESGLFHLLNVHERLLESLAQDLGPGRGERRGRQFVDHHFVELINALRSCTSIEQVKKTCLSQARDRTCHFQRLAVCVGILTQYLERDSQFRKAIYEDTLCAHISEAEAVWVLLEAKFLLNDLKLQQEFSPGGILARCIQPEFGRAMVDQVVKDASATDRRIFKMDEIRKVFNQL